MTHLTELRRLAEGATPGPWAYRLQSGLFVVHSSEQGGVAFDVLGPDAAFIAAANPSTVLQLLDQVERLERTMGMALNAVSVDAIECVGATKTKQYFVTEWAMNRVREALRELGGEG